MRIYFDTEFTQFRDGLLLSAGFVSDSDAVHYVEIDTPERRSAASDFCRQHVISQFGCIPRAAVASDAEAGERIAAWILSFQAPVILSFDYQLDWYFVEQALRSAHRWKQLSRIVTRHNVANEANQESAIAAQEAYFKQPCVPGRHHALTDAYALRARWREHLRLSGTGFTS